MDIPFIQLVLVVGVVWTAAGIALAALHHGLKKWRR